jgi:hypothetical protein
MSSHKDPSFQERAALAAAAKQKALEKLRAKPQIDPAIAAERAAARQAKQLAEAEKRAAKQAARDKEIAEKKARQQEAAEKAAAAVQVKVLTDEERKAIRDAKYAARKNRKK